MPLPVLWSSCVDVPGLRRRPLATHSAAQLPSVQWRSADHCSLLLPVLAVLACPALSLAYSLQATYTAPSLQSIWRWLAMIWSLARHSRSTLSTPTWVSRRRQLRHMQQMQA